jgi:fructose-1,6-bisphosphatase I
MSAGWSPAMQSLSLTQHIRQAQLTHPEARGELSALLTQIGVAGKVISSKVNMAGLAGLLGSTGEMNVQGEVVQKLDEYAEAIIEQVVGTSGYVCALLSEEREEVIAIDEDLRGPYIVAYDPLDGSSNIDANVSIGTIFGIYRKISEGTDVDDSDILQPGRNQVAAGYILYGSSSVFVYTAGDGVHGFTLDPSVGEYLLSHENIQLDGPCKVLSVNHCNAPYWSPWVPKFINEMISRNDEVERRVTGRHIGSLVADFHRNLMYGGVYLYPTDRRSPNGKLRLMYEANPLAFIAREAGGYASDGVQAILDITPQKLHHRTGLIIGNEREVRFAEDCLASCS